MKTLVKTLALTTALSMFSLVSAIAADDDIDVLLEPESTFVEFGDGWYLRGDITYNLHGRQSTGFGSIGQTGESLYYDYNDAIGLRAGFGYNLGSGFRVELTGESVLSASFEGTGAHSFAGSRDVAIVVQTSPATTFTDPFTGITTLVPAVFTTYNDTVFFNDTGAVTGSASGYYQTYIGNTAPTINGSETVEASYSASNFMVNGYYDLPELGKFTPYVGAGLGVARINYNERRIWDCLADSTEACGYPAGAQGAPVEDFVAMDYHATYWRMSWQLAAGFAIKVSEKASLDFGYSYLNLGKGTQLSYADGTAINAAGISIHRFNVGLRYEIW